MTDNFDPHITCEGIQKAKDISSYTTKEIVFDSTKTQMITPIKTMDMDGLTGETLPLYSSIKMPLILESALYVWHPQTWRSINDIIEGDLNDTTKLLKILSLKPNLYKRIPDTLATTSVVFSRHPFRERVSVSKYRVNKYPPLDRSNFETFLQDLYSYSRGMVLIPDIKIANIPKKPPLIPKTMRTIEIEEYLDIISEFTTILSEKNKKPIFVPIQTTLTKKAAKQILSFYKSMGYSNIWINFSAGEVWGRNLAGLRTILNVLDSTFGPEGYFVYCSHMKKEIAPNLVDNKTASSDMLSQFFGADIVGTNREPLRILSDEVDQEEYVIKKGFTSVNEYKKALQLHKARIFDPASYYYYKPTHHPSLSRGLFTIVDLVKSVTKNKAVDSFMKFKEVEQVKESYDKNKKIKGYLKEKALFKEREDILNEISGDKPTVPDKTLFDFE